MDQRHGFIWAGAILFAAFGANHFCAAHTESAPRAMQARAANAAASDSRCEVDETAHEGLPAVRISNHWVELILVPKLGGRLMQVKFAGHPYLFENPQLKGKYFPPLATGAKPDWYNYGGDKIWPMPEGHEDGQHWPGPIADALDDGDYQATVVSGSPRCTVRLDGPADQRTGLQYSREISLTDDSPEISFHAVMKNASARPIEWSMQSVTQYDTADPRTDDYNHNFWAFTPVNPKSAYFDGFHVRFGLADDPSFSVSGGLFRLHWLYLQNEVWIDSPGDWLTVVDRTAGYAMVEQFRYQPGAEYPGKASVIFYKNGPSVEMNDRGRPEIRIDPEDAPFYMEAEINSPMAKLAPGESHAMDTTWFPARTGNDFIGVSEAGMIAEALLATRTATGVRIHGSFGAFYPGQVIAEFLDTNGASLGSAPLGNADPGEMLNLNQEIHGPAGTVRVRVSIEGGPNKNRGVLGEAAVTGNS